MTTINAYSIIGTLKKCDSAGVDWAHPVFHMSYWKDCDYGRYADGNMPSKEDYWNCYRVKFGENVIVEKDWEYGGPKVVDGPWSADLMDFINELDKKADAVIISNKKKQGRADKRAATKAKKEAKAFEEARIAEYNRLKEEAKV